MLLIERYLFRRVLALTMMTLVSATLVVLITQVLKRVNLLTQNGQTIASFLDLAAMLTPTMAMIVLPFALLVGVSRTLNTMNADSEMAVLEAAGGSQWVVARPVITLGVILTVVSLVFALFVEPASNRRVRDILSRAGADLIRLAVQTGTFTQIGPDIYIQISEELPGGDFGGIVIADGRDETTDLTYYAKRGTIKTFNDRSLLFLVDGEVHRRNKAGGEVSMISFATSAIDFSSFAGSTADPFYFPQERTTGFLLNPDLKDKLAKDSPQLLRRELHRRFSEWLFPLALGIVAVYFAGGAQSHRDERVWQIVIGFIVALGARGLGFFTASMAGSGPWQAAVAYATPIGTIVLFTLLIALGWRQRISRRWLDRLETLSAWRNRLAGLQLRLPGFRRGATEGRP